MSHSRRSSDVWLASFIMLVTGLLPTAWADDDFNLIITLDRDHLQRRVERLFPIVREDLLISVKLHHPEVILRENSDRIGLRLQLNATAAEQYTVAGTALVDGVLRYEAKRGEFYLDDARVTELKLEELAPPLVEQIRLLAEAVVRQALHDYPLYVLGQMGESKRIMGSEIKSVTVRSGKLLIELAMP